MVDLRREWADLLGRRPALASALGLGGRVIEAWARAPAGRVVPLAWTPAECAERWERGAPLLAECDPAALPREAVEACLEPAMEIVARLGAGPAAGMQRLAAAWDRGEVGPADLCPRPGRLGSPDAEAAVGVTAACLGFLCVASLRPLLDELFAPCRSHLQDLGWMLGVCPFCGAPAAWADIAEDGRRRLACHLCGAGWDFARMRCPFCGSDRSDDHAVLRAEGADEGFAVVACRACRGYLKTLDRRVRWNAASPLVEDWGTPHLDLVAERGGHWRPVPTPLTVARSPGGPVSASTPGTGPSPG